VTYPPVFLPPHAVTAPTARKRRWPRIVFSVIVVLALLVVAGQTWELDRLHHDLVSADHRAATDGKRITSLEASSKSVRATLAAGMDSMKVAADGLPSVFEVDAGDYLGTGWGVSHPAEGGTDLITNFHVIAEVYNQGKRSVDIDHKAERFTATVKRINKTQDLALLHVSQVFPVLAVDKSAQPGEPVVVLGEPLGLEDTVTVGVISALHRTVPELGNRTFIQFDAAINPGNSGGPVVNAQEQVVGVASDKLVDAEGLGLAIPIATACQYLQTC
jgi:S1-C subfamily serine protease